MTEPITLLKKLQIRPGARLWLINVPRDVVEGITAGGAIEPVHAGEPFDGAIAFCETVPEVEAFSRQILEHLPEDGLLWLAYRKGATGKSTGLSRDSGWAALEQAGYRPVQSVAIDDDWTGLQFGPVGADG